MRHWNELLNKAMLGSSKSPMLTSDIPSEILTAFDVSDIDDQEENFLRLSSLVFQFRQSGSLPLRIETMNQREAEPELSPYCSRDAMNVLNQILEEGHEEFLKLWLAHCEMKKQLAHAEIIPALFEIAEHRPDLKTVILNVSGKRGQWLTLLNPEWSWLKLKVDDPMELWQHGKLDERKELLETVRTNDRASSVKLLQSSWNTEGANEKLAFLEIIKINPGNEDLWLESLNEKSQKVTKAIAEVLKLVPESSIVQSYKNALSSAIEIRSDKALLGMINKTRIHVLKNTPIPEELFKTGIDKLSSDKNISDEQFILIQLIAAVPPSFWTVHFQQRTKEDIIDLFQKEKDTALYLPALGLAALKFRDTEWIKALLHHGDKDLLSGSIPSLIEGLTGKERDTYAQKFFNDFPHEIISVMLENEIEWSELLTQMILKFAIAEIHQYNKNFYRRISPLVPVQSLASFESFAPADEPKKVYWRNYMGELTTLLNLKKQLLQSFNA